VFEGYEVKPGVAPNLVQKMAKLRQRQKPGGGALGL